MDSPEPNLNIRQDEGPPNTWVLCEQDFWQDLHDDWWDTPSDTFGNIIEIKQRRVWSHLGHLSRSKGKIYVREEYKAMYSRMEGASRLSRSSGVVITGQPGIGMSYFAIYALLRRISSKCSVIFHSHMGESYWFHERRVWEKATESILPRDLGYAPQTWSLIDPPVGRNHIAESLTDNGLFHAIFSPLNVVRFKHFRYAPRWLFSPWTDDELSVLFQTDGMVPVRQHIAKECSTPAGIAALSSQVGGCPRDIICLLTNRTRIMNNLYASAHSLRDVSTLNILLTAPMRLPSDSDASEAYTLIRRQTPLHLEDPNETQDDAYFVDVKGDLAYRPLMDCIMRLNMVDSRDLFVACRPSPWRETVFFGYVFTCIAQRLLSGSFPTVGHAPLYFFAPMKEQNGNATHPVRFAYSRLGSAQATDTVDLFELSSTSPSFSAIPPVPLSDIPISSREIYKYTSLDDISVTFDTCYVPAGRDNPLFDAFFYEIPPKRAASDVDVILWIFQATVGSSHNSNAEGFDMVEKLMAKAVSATGRRVQVKYVLVVPCSDDMVRTYDVEWNMASSFDRVRGDVFVQFVSIDRLADDR